MERLNPVTSTETGLNFSALEHSRNTAVTLLTTILLVTSGFDGLISHLHY